MSVPNFMRFRRKRLEKQTRIDHFSLKKNPKRIYLASRSSLKKNRKKYLQFFFP